MWPMTQARLCYSDSEGTDGQKYQAGPGSPRRGWNEEQTPPVKIGDAVFHGGAQYGVGGSGPPLLACPT